MTLKDKPAFPVPMVPCGNGGYTECREQGMTLREYYAGLAMASLLGKYGCLVGESLGLEACVEESLGYADALIAELEKTNSGENK